MRQITKRSFVVLVILLFCLLAAFVAQQYAELREPGVIVLLYHRVEREGSGNKYTLRLSKFEEQLSYLHNQGYKTILPKEIVESGLRQNPPKTIILSFDDGTEDHYETVYPALKKYGFKGIFFIVTKYINSPGSLTSDQIRKMSKNRMEIGSHSYSHPFLDELANSEIYHELKKSKDDLEKISGQRITSFAPPGGWFNDAVIKAARDIGYQAFFSCEIGYNDLQKHPFIYKRIEVLEDMSNEEFKDLLQPSSGILGYKLIQSVKNFLHNLIGSNNYKMLGRAL